MSKQVIFILGGGIIEDLNGWRTTTFFEEGDLFGALGDRLRVEAAHTIYRKNINTTLLVPSGGRGQLRDHPSAPTVASVIAGELSQLGVLQEHVLLEEVSNNTHEQLQALGRLINDYQWSEVTILTNDWHIARARAFVEADVILKSHLEQERIEFVAAEAVLLHADSARWEAMISDVYKSESMYQRIEKEEQGIRAIKEGTYGLTKNS